MLTQSFFFDDQIDRNSDSKLEHKHLTASNLDSIKITESNKEISLDFKYSLKRAG